MKCCSAYFKFTSGHPALWAPWASVAQERLGAALCDNSTFERSVCLYTEAHTCYQKPQRVVARLQSQAVQICLEQKKGFRELQKVHSYTRGTGLDLVQLILRSLCAHACVCVYVC